MSSVHDMGGMEGVGPVDVEEAGLSFTRCGKDRSLDCLQRFSVLGIGGEIFRGSDSH